MIKKFNKFYNDAINIFNKYGFKYDGDYDDAKEFCEKSLPKYRFMSSDYLQYSNYEGFSKKLKEFINLGFRKESKEHSGLTTSEYNYNYDGAEDEVIKEGRLGTYIQIIDGYDVEIRASGQDYKLWMLIRWK